MCWSRARIYDRPFLACLDEIDAAIARLRARGATGFVVAGQSLGGSAALAYGARHDGLLGIVGLAPAPAPGVARRPEIARSLEQAKEMVANGRGDQRASFSDINERPITVEASAEAFLSFLALDGPANIVQNSAHLKAPLLWVAGDQDGTQQGRDFAFGKAPSSPLNRYASIHSTHLGTPEAGGDAVLGWLKEVAAAHQGVAR
jgi:pimeloyl-ACP methyl ester carboxylesterase